ncbi:zinc finger A20 and AN1 domain-containing stress-associated protein 7-like [Cryptomeria japonica]|uniref:zinc finger A20 and AN1 domain-containing stress-associated protein 7-like n=1 Tax=Cryptomeria japonica TaxID=3369 RepID=UPI0027DA18A5|nr:zinc finger A20 and AN1 domain-containing stress-associated protein 7-like [Cryptomeria japonica]
MSEENNLCINKCGFFGTAENMNMCSFCYKKYMEKQSLAEKVAKKAKGKEESEAAEWVYPEEHNCSFDHKRFGRQSLAKNNPLIKGSKIDKL